MESLYIEQMLDSPKITLDYENGFIEFDGKSYPANSYTFYAPVLDWLEKYFDGKAKEKTTVNIKLIYFNSSSSQILLQIFDIINEGTYNEIEINWFYPEEDENCYEEFRDMDEEFPELAINGIVLR